MSRSADAACACMTSHIISLSEPTLLLITLAVGQNPELLELVKLVASGLYGRSREGGQLPHLAVEARDPWASNRGWLHVSGTAASPD